MEGSCTTNQETKECRPMQIEIGTTNKEKDEQQENMIEEQEIQECYYTDT